MPSIVKEWISSLPYKQQAVLLLALRGCDGVPKNDPAKPLVRWYRHVILNNAAEPGTKDYGTFMSPAPPNLKDAFYERPDHYPVHWLMHFLYGAEIVGYKHPDERMREYWSVIYLKGVTALHLNPETEEQLDERLTPGPLG